jgi:hypothetical protein
MGRGREKRQTNPSFAAHTPANVSDLALLFGLRVHVDQKQALAARDDGFERQLAALIVGVDCVSFFVERLLVCVGTVHEQGDGVRNARGFPAIRVIFRAGFCATARGIAPFGASPLSLRLLQRFPNAAQDKLRIQLACCGPYVKDSWGRRV